MPSERHAAGDFGEKPQRTGEGISNNDNTNQRGAVGSGAKGLATGESMALSADRGGIKVGRQSAGVAK